MDHFGIPTERLLRFMDLSEFYEEELRYYDRGAFFRPGRELEDGATWHLDHATRHGRLPFNRFFQSSTGRGASPCVPTCAGTCDASWPSTAIPRICRKTRHN
jgi:hypothetical protein